MHRFAWTVMLGVAASQVTCRKAQELTAPTVAPVASSPAAAPQLEPVAQHERAAQHPSDAKPDLTSPVTKTGPSPAATQRAQKLNAEGYRLYRARKYVEALRFFRQAWEADQTHALAHYNYAATLALLRRDRRAICEHEAYRQTIVQHLTRAVELDPARRERMQADPDFDTVRDTVGYQRLLGLSPAKSQDVPVLLERVRWFGPGVGAYGTLFGIDFAPGGKLRLWYREVTDSEAQPVRETTIRGTWRVEGNTALLELEKPYHGKRALRATLTAEGTLELSEEPSRLFDSESECEA